VAIDREETLKKAEKLLRQGRLDGAIAEYQRVVDEFPRDWNTANTLGDCFYRAHQVERAAEEFNRIADHFAHEGFFPKAAALYKKSLKIKPDDVHALQQAAEIAIRQGTLVEAKQYLNTLAERRRAAGDAKGAAEVLLRIGALDPDDLEARLAAVGHGGGGGRRRRVPGHCGRVRRARPARARDRRARRGRPALAG
jgi:tetratricopeptide (TPR) repeat protein